MRAYLMEAVRACRAAGRIQMRAFGGSHAVEHKGEIDLVTSVDRESEARIIEILSGSFPGHSFIAEESSPSAGEAEFLWLIDPLDGTTNYSRGFPFFCVSIALCRQGEVIVAAVYSPVLDEIFTAVRGGGAYLGGVRLSVSAEGRLGKAFLATGFPYDIRRSRRNNLDHFARFATRCLAVRRAGAAALDLAYVAAGRFDGFWELKLKPWDMAAGVLLVEEAGGTVTTPRGRPWRVGDADIVASNGLIHRPMLAVLGEGTPRSRAGSQRGGAN